METAEAYVLTYPSLPLEFVIMIDTVGVSFYDLVSLMTL